MSSKQSKTPLFLLGIGYIGGSVLTSLLSSGKYDITALTRKEEQAETLRKLGVTPLLGSLDSEELIVKATLQNDIIMHTATADDQPSVKAILKGLSQKSKDAPHPIFIHTSGTGLLRDDGRSVKASDKVFSDETAEDIDALPDDAWHRDVDLLIKNAVDRGEIGNARVAIILPAVVYGLGDGPFKRISIDIPAIIESAIKEKEVGVIGQGKALWGSVHIKNLVSAYEIILAHLSVSKSPARPLYFFASHTEFQWLDLFSTIRDSLEKRGLVKHDLRMNDPPAYHGTNSRCRSDRLNALGWKVRDYGTVHDEVEVDVKEVLAQSKVE